jgi:hypothetical protein
VLFELRRLFAGESDERGEARVASQGRQRLTQPFDQSVHTANMGRAGAPRKGRPAFQTQRPLSFLIIVDE